MVRGLELFRDHFSDLTDRYVLIGGTACDLIMDQVGLEFRATSDLDIVLCIESVDTDFAEAFWQFVKVGQYEVNQSAEGKPRFYRFVNPANREYPRMLELFSPVPEALSIADGHLTPIPIDGQTSSLSAILLDEDYYGWVQSGKQVIEGLPVVGAIHMLALKVKAWLDMRERKAAGDKIPSREVNKHKYDVFRLYQVIEPETQIQPPDNIMADMATFLELIPHENIDLKSLGLRTLQLETVTDGLRKLYRVDHDQESES